MARRSRCLVVPLVAVLAAACGQAAAAPQRATDATPVVAVGSARGALALVDRLTGAHDDAVLPALTGFDVAAARAAVAGLGATVHVLAFDASSVVSAQYPAPGAPLPVDGAVVLWTGLPPDPPPPPAPPTPSVAPVAATLADVRTHASERPQNPVPAALADAPAAAPVATPAAHPPRSNIRTIAPLPAGTVLSGSASWYGPGFVGRQTACGGIFDPAQLTLASRELRCGTRLLVTGPSGANVEAVATDWGPAEWTGRRFDLSHATFAAIHHPGAGVVDVTIEVVG